MLNKICLWECPVPNKVVDYKSAALLKLNFFTGIFQRSWPYNQSDTLNAILENICFCRTSSSMITSFHSLNSNNYYILFTPIETFACNY